MKQLKKNFIIILLFQILFLSFFNFKLYSIQEADSMHYYSQLFTQAENLRKQGEFEKSIEYLEKSLTIAKKISDKEKECESLIHLGLMLWNIGDLRQSTIFYEQALSLAKKINLEEQQEICQSALDIYRLYDEGKKFRSSGKYQESIESFQKAIVLAKNAKSKEHLVKCLRQLSASFWEINNFKRFFTLNNKALKIAEELNHKKEEGRCLNNIGLYYWKIDQYSRALNYYEKALIIAKHLKNKKEESSY